MMECVSWDDDMPNIWKVLESHKIHVPNHQAVIQCLLEPLSLSELKQVPATAWD